MEIKGIDVSSNNGIIDWDTVAGYGMGFAILRVHQRNGIDSTFENNYKGCKSNGIPVGVYKYSYAKTVDQAEREAEDVLAVLNGRGLDFQVFYDLEWGEQRKLGSAAIEQIAVAFLVRMQKAGYKVGIYCNVDWYNNVLTPELKEYDCWLAAYPANDNGELQERLRPTAGIGWQYSESAKIPGIRGVVDRNVFYKDYTGRKDETKVSQLQKFIDLGNYYADAANGQKHPYLEKKSNAYLDDFTKNAGYNNYTLFARDVNSWGQPGCQAQPWCAEYQFWKLVKVLGITRALQIMGGGFYNCVSITNHAKTNGTWHSTPKKGALVIFRNGAHVGSVNSYDPTYINTNEGNTSSAPGVEANGGSARNKRYRRDDSCIDGYVWIDWETESEQEEWKASGTATATVDNLYVRETPNGYILGEVMKGNRFEIDGQISGSWTHVKVDGIGIGWIWTAYIKKDGQAEKPAETISSKQDKNQRLFVGRVTADVLNVRIWAGTEYPTIKKWPQLAKGNLVDVMNYTQTATDGSKWYFVRIAGRYLGFVSEAYVEV